ncbi:MAG: hypothetical protein WD898_01775 [Candidatus Paceibacterota bacterium]
MAPNLEENILATIAYYDVLDFPLKEEEVFRFLINFEHLDASKKMNKPALDEVRNRMADLMKAGAIDSDQGYYFLTDKKYLAPLRLKKEKIAREKWAKTLRAVKWIRLVPNVRAVFASGSLAISNTDELSDLDVLIVAKHGRIWLTRLFITVWLSLLRVRRSGSEKIAPDKVCLNHYITDKSPGIPYGSMYNAQTYINLVPIFIRDEETLKNFQRENGWVLTYVFDWPEAVQEKKIGNGFAGMIGKAKEWFLNNRFGDFLENMARRYQSVRIERNPLTKKAGGRVIFTDEQLEFHPESVEDKIIERYNQRLRDLGLSHFAKEKNSGLT